MDQASSLLCCLCITSCNEFKSLYDNNGQLSKFYKISVKYFESTLLNPEEKSASRLICLECWKHIYDFHSYQQTIIRVQSQLRRHVDPITSVVKFNEDNEITNEPFSVFDIIINGENDFPKSITSQISLSYSDKHDETVFNGEEINSAKRRKLKYDATVPTSEGGELECIECNETFESYVLFNKHYQSEHPEQERDRKLNNRCKVVANIRKFHNQIDDSSYKCECCTASFSQYLSLKKHILKMHTATAVRKYSKSFKKKITCNDKFDEDSTTELSLVQIRREEGQSNEIQDNISSISIDSNDIDEIYEIFKESPEKEKTSCSYNQVRCSSHHKSNIDTHIDSNEANNVLDDSKTLENDNTIANLKGDLECPNCKEIFTYYSLLHEHFIKEHPNVKCHIVCCKSKFYKSNKIVKHLAQLHGRKDKNEYSCKMCGASFSQYGSLRRHIRKKHAVQSLLKWLCNYCKREFKTRSNLESHKKKVHSKDISNINVEEHSEDEQSDQIQDNIYSSSIVSNDIDDICELVQEKEKSSAYIPNETPYSYVVSNDHIQQPPLEIIDVKDEILISSDNESVANYPDNLTNDMNNSYSETEQNNFEYDAYIAKWKDILKCPKCRRIFANFSLLDTHFREEHEINNGCYIICCQTGLNDRGMIVEHLRNYHKDPSGFRCDICDKSFKSDRSLRSHKRQVHIDKRSKYHLHLCYCKRSKAQDAETETLSAKYNTAICCERKQKTLEDDAIISKWKQELKCRLCESTFSYYSMMHAHFYYEHPGEKCYIICCERNFNRMSDALEHIRIHLDPYAFKCELCNLPFAGKSSLSKHLQLIHGEISTNKFACDQCDKSFSHGFVLTRHKNACHTTQTDKIKCQKI